MAELLRLTCRGCGLPAELGPGMVLPEAGGFLLTIRGEVQEWTCRECWTKVPRTWTCKHCGAETDLGANFRVGCHQARPDPLPYRPDPYELAKEAYWRQREFEARVAEADREFPGWRFALGRPSKRF